MFISVLSSQGIEKNTREAERNAPLWIMFYPALLSGHHHFVVCFITDKIMVKLFVIWKLV